MRTATGLPGDGTIFTARKFEPQDELAARCGAEDGIVYNIHNKPAAQATTVSAATLQSMTFAPIRYVVPGYIAEGCTVLAGAPKLGKSGLALDMAISKATGGCCLGSVQTPEAEDVLFLALEDNLRRLQSRIDRLVLAGAPWPPRLTFATEWPRADQCGIERIRAWAQSKDKPRLVIVDVLAMFRPPITGRDNAYQADYNSIKSLQSLASELSIAVVIVHHTRKSRDQVDPFDRVSGTLGLSGAADSVLVLDRDGQGVTLYGRGRDIPEIETAVSFSKDLCRWKIQGQASEVRRSDERSAVLHVLKMADAPVTPVTVSDATGMSRVAMRQLLLRMAAKGEVLKKGVGKYVHPDRMDLL